MNNLRKYIRKVLSESFENLNSISIEEIFELIEYSDSYRDLYPGNNPEFENEYEEDYYFKSKEEAYTEAEDTINFFKNMPDPIPIYRSIHVKTLEDIDYDYIGDSWSYEKNSALNFAKIHNGGNVLLSGFISKDSVDWKNTLKNHFHFSRFPDDSNEDEIKVEDFDKIKSIKVEWIKNIISEENNINKSLKKILDSDDAYEILDSTKAVGSTWTQGGCAILAFALNKAYGYPVYVIYDNDLKQADHFVAKTPSGTYVDYDGEGKDKVVEFKELEGLWNKDFSLIPYNQKINVSNIVLDDNASEKLSKLILGEKLLFEDVDSEKIWSGKEVNNHIRDITPDEGGLPDFFMKRLIAPRNFKIQKIELTDLLNDEGFREYFESGEERYDSDEVNHDDLEKELVVVDGELLDGYSRASALLRNGEKNTYAFVAI